MEQSIFTAPCPQADIARGERQRRWANAAVTAPTITVPKDFVPVVTAVACVRCGERIEGHYMARAR